jgi:hypothetical protein
MHPLLPEEMGGDFDLDAALRHGTLALVAASEEAERDDRLAAYVQTYLKEEIKAEALVRNLPGFARFLPVAALCHAQVVNVRCWRAARRRTRRSWRWGGSWSASCGRR